MKRVFFNVISDVFMSRYSMFFMWSALISSGFISIFSSSSNLADSILPPTLFMALLLSSRSSKYVAGVEICLSCSTIFDENFVFFYCLGVLWELQCFWFDINQFFILFVKNFMLFVKQIFVLVNYGLDCGVKERFQHNV